MTDMKKPTIQKTSQGWMVTAGHRTWGLFETEQEALVILRGQRALAAIEIEWDSVMTRKQYLQDKLGKKPDAYAQGQVDVLTSLRAAIEQEDEPSDSLNASQHKLGLDAEQEDDT